MPVCPIEGIIYVINGMGVHTIQYGKRLRLAFIFFKDEADSDIEKDTTSFVVEEFVNL